MSEYNRKRGHIGGGLAVFNNNYTFNNPNPLSGSHVPNLVFNHYQVPRPDSASSIGGMGLNQMEPSSGTQVLYGTNINSSEVQMKIRNFINTFIQMDENDDKFDQMPYYIEQLKNINETE